MISSILLYIHITAGSIALLAAPVALITTKGGVNHKRVGKVYAIAMTVVFLTAVPLALLISSVFLLLISGFSFYLVFSGWRFARNYSGRAQIIDWAAVTIMILTGLGMWGYAIVLATSGDSQWITMVVFGALAVALGLADLQFYWRPPTSGTQRISRHLTNMMGGTIATVTAVMVVNIDFDPVWVPWILPTIVITPLIVWWNFRVKRQNRRRPVRS